MSEIHLQAFWERAKGDAFFLASLCGQFAEHRQWSLAELAAHLECSLLDLLRIGACRAPSGHGNSFQQNVDLIAQCGHCNASKLMALVREGAALRTLSEADSRASMLLAAKDRKVDEQNVDTFNNVDKTE